ncbi:LysM peptidoglycan-binding domain-containing protein [Paenisporosarcina cavernae]|uniref:LysM peptidoglycan-binding domain-containing protein n=1 Tax=Paenisporosarcina cavernae TaxID=2320858 RepID=A0A385YRG6_9BACL|nr:LysM peptidoglycan-binding domain-containing protein [Paenisporosarcina cavernae]AYC29365.1 LysM peptidoglycan-binding domain-containing protein [Paenisporosarcina cavernae]
MSNEEYKDSIERHRKAVNLEEESSPSRRTRRTSKKQAVTKQSNRKNPLMPILFFIFIMIPIGFLIYIQFFYDPSATETTVDESITYEENTTTDSSDTNVDENIEEDAIDKKEDTGTEDNVSEDVPSSDTPIVEPAEERTQAGDDESSTDSTPNQGSKTHTVAPGETLYRIAMNYYNDPSAVDKIKAANGLSSDSISAGQELILP